MADMEQKVDDLTERIWLLRQDLVGLESQTRQIRSDVIQGLPADFTVSTAGAGEMISNLDSLGDELDEVTDRIERAVDMFIDKLPQPTKQLLRNKWNDRLNVAAVAYEATRPEVRWHEDLRRWIPVRKHEEG